MKISKTHHRTKSGVVKRNPRKKIESNNAYGYIGKPIKCSCGGIFEYYDGALGYESLVCNKCHKDIQDMPEMLKKC